MRNVLTNSPGQMIPSDTNEICDCLSLKCICLALYKILLEQAFRVIRSVFALKENMNRICCLINAALKDFPQKLTLENIFWIKVTAEAPVPVHSSSVFSFAWFLIDLALPSLR